MKGMTWQLLPIIGKRTFLGFGLVTFLVAALLSAVSITSRYALSLYVEDQLDRTPWDLVVYDQSGGSNPTLAARMSSLENMQQVEQLVFLRASFSSDVTAMVDGQPLGTPWLSVISASDPSLLPPELRSALTQGAMTPGSEPQATGAILALVGPERAMGDAFISLQGARDFELQANVDGTQTVLFSSALRGVIRLEADALNRWFMEQTGSITMTPAVAAILLMPFREDVLTAFDLAARGQLATEDRTLGNPEFLPGEYLPEIAYLAKLEREHLISSWDIGGSLRRFTEVRDQALDAVRGVDVAAVVDSTVLVLLERMDAVARLIGLLTLLIALPLLWMAWIFQSNLAGLLMLNERRKLGLLRLRGVPGRFLGRAFLFAIASGGFIGGILGLLVGSVVPLLIYGRGQLPPDVLTQRSQLYLSLLFLFVTLAMALLVGRRLVRYATTISPLEASTRIATSEVSRTEVRFGPLELLSVVLGAYTLGSWIFGLSLSSRSSGGFVWILDRALDFMGLPLFVYGIVCLLVSRKSLIQRLLEPLVILLGGRLGPLALTHIALRPHRTVLFLLTVALMVSVSLYPTVTAPSFEDKAVRGARVGTGADWQLTFNAPDLAPMQESSTELSTQLSALRTGIERVRTALESVPGVTSVTAMPEVVLQDFYLPGYGLRGVPLYLISEPDGYLDNVYSEPALGIGEPFREILTRLNAGDVVVSPPVSEFWELSRGSEVPLGVDSQFETIGASVSGTVAFLSGMPLRSVTDREGYVRARVDYLNSLFTENGYLVASAENPIFAEMQGLIPRVTVLVTASSRSSSFRDDMLRALPVTPLEVHNVDEEVQKVGGDMFVYLARANMNLYLLGGLLLALVSILTIALVNYSEDRRTLALLRIRGASPDHIRRFVIALILSPALLGVAVGGVVAVLAGYGLASYLWTLREIESVIQLLPTHLVASALTGGVSVLILVVLAGAAFSFGQWTFRRTARESLLEA